MTVSPDRLNEAEELILSAIARLRAGVMAVVGATFGGAGILVATTWLLIRGGANVGQHLNLLRNYLPGYSVSWTGALVGSVYGVLIGGSVGWLTAWIYNRIVDARHSDRYHGADSVAR